MDAWKRIKALWHPEMYHGWGRQNSYFEGWYIKVVNASRDGAYAIIPGISMDDRGSQHAFIQVLDGIAAKAWYYSFPESDFHPDPNRFALCIGPNRFESDGIFLDLPLLSGELRFTNRFPWPGTLLSPGVMGWYSFVPRMECYHGVLSMDHRIAGTLYRRDRKEEVSFDGGLGYMEKDWGRSFPSWWIWLQSNHFSGGGRNSLMVSVARIPFMGSHFNGFLGAWLFEGTLYRFTTYHGARLTSRLEGENLYITMTQGPRRLEISGSREAGSGELRSPIRGEMTGKVNESLQGILEVSFYVGDRLVYRDTGHMAGLEVAGEVPEHLMC